MFHNILYYITILLLPSWKRKCFEWNTENCLQAWAKIMEKVTKQSRGLCGFLVKKWSDIFNTKTKLISLFLNLLSNSLECINKKVRKFDYIRVRFIDHTLNNVKPYLKCLGWDDTQFPMTSWSFYSCILLHRNIPVSPIHETISSHIVNDWKGVGDHMKALCLNEVSLCNCSMRLNSNKASGAVLRSCILWYDKWRCTEEKSNAANLSKTLSDKETNLF